MMLELYTWATANGHKPQILLEELDVPYSVKPVNIFEGEQLTDFATGEMGLEVKLHSSNRRQSRSASGQKRHLATRLGCPAFPQ